MSNDTSLENESPEESTVIRGLRQDVKDLTKAVKTAGEDAVAKVKRGQTASTLLPEEYKGLSDVFEAEVDGELTDESAVEWLKGRGFSTAASDEASEEAAKQAADLERVTNLGGAVAAASNLTPADSVTTQLGEVLKPGTPQTLQEVTSAIETIIHG